MATRFCCAVLFTGMLHANSMAGGPETIGPYTVIRTPSAASIVSGGGAPSTWLNETNASVTVSEALTGFSVIADGYANAPSGTAILVTFAPGDLTNRPGSDLVLLDANSDLNMYRVRTSYDGFSQETMVNSFADTGVDKMYFVGGAGPSSFDITAAPIDLSVFGIPDGAVVEQMRLFCEGPSNDPVGLAVLESVGPVVPTTSSWTIASFALLLLSAGTIIQRRVPWHRFPFESV